MSMCLASRARSDQKPNDAGHANTSDDDDVGLVMDTTELSTEAGYDSAVEEEGWESTAEEDWDLVNAEVQRWDVKQDAKKSVVGTLRMVLPAMMRVPGNLIGVTLATGGYAMGKAGEVVGGGKAVDSVAFQMGFKSWMTANGIFPHVEYEPLPDPGQSPQDMTSTPILVSNHISYLDGPILAGLFGAPKIVAKRGARAVPIVGKLMDEMEVIFVDRSNGDSRQATLDAISDHCDSWTSGSRPLLIFPEGTTTNGTSIIDFKRGAFVGGKPVRPVLIVYTGQWDPAATGYTATSDGLEKSTDAAWGMEFLGHFVHSLHVRVLPPYVPSRDEKANPKLYAEGCHRHMEEELKRVREEVRQRSWKESAGRTDGGWGYRFGDVTRSVVHHFMRPSAGSASAHGATQSRQNATNRPS